MTSWSKWLRAQDIDVFHTHMVDAEGRPVELTADIPEPPADVRFWTLTSNSEAVELREIYIHDGKAFPFAASTWSAHEAPPWAGFVYRLEALGVPDAVVESLAELYVDHVS